MTEQQTGRDIAIGIGHKAVDWPAMLSVTLPSGPDRTRREILLSSRRIVELVVDALAAAGLLASTPPASDPAVEMECPSCGAMVQSRLQDQAVIAELRKQGWAPPVAVEIEAGEHDA